MPEPKLKPKSKKWIVFLLTTERNRFHYFGSQKLPFTSCKLQPKRRFGLATEKAQIGSKR